MKKLFPIFFTLLLIGCGVEMKQKALVFDASEKLPPEENRFVKEILATNVFEPTEMDILPDGRVLFVERRGGVKLYDPKTEKLSNYDSIPVFITFEDGLMGMALDPNFEYNRWVYLYYSYPGKEAKQQLSRFRFTENGLVDEKVMLVVPTQREECCHTGGSIQFGANGLLYLSTGDNTNPFFSDGYGPMDDSTTKTSRDARGTSSNTNDLRGKILRIKPESNGTYSIPKGNLFEDDNPLTRPEIYVMGCRNPYRISVDPIRNWLFWGEVGPDAGNDKPERGPRGHDEVNVAQQPGYFGWPLFVGDNKAYQDYDFATMRPGGLFDPNNPINDSRFNTGLKNLPPAQPAMIWYPYANSKEFPMLKTGGRNAMAGPVFYSDRFPYSATRLPSYFDGRLFIYDWVRGWIFSVDVSDGTAKDFFPFMPATKFDYIIDMELGPDGSLYLLEYGTGWFTHNKDSKLTHIKYMRGNRNPVLKATASVQNGAAPLKVVLDASTSLDFDGDSLTYEWEVEGEKTKQAKIEYTFNKEGVFYPRITIRDSKGNKATQQLVIEVGNEAPELSIAIAGNTTFYYLGRKVSYEIGVSDKEDGALNAGIEPEAVDFEINYIKGFDKTAVGHQKPITNGQTLMDASDCKACHKLDDASAGPSYMQVSKKYANTNSQKYLANKIRTGGGGVWGEQAMSAHPSLSEEEALQIVDYILSLTASKQPLIGTYLIEKADADGQYLFTAGYKDRGSGNMRPVERSVTCALINPKIKADQFADGEGFSAGVGHIDGLINGSWLSFEDLDLTDVKSIRIRLDKNAKSGTWIIRLDGRIGSPVARIALSEAVNGVVEATLSAKGVHDLYFTLETDQQEAIRCFDLEFSFN